MASRWKRGVVTDSYLRMKKRDILVDWLTKALGMGKSIVTGDKVPDRLSTQVSDFSQSRNQIDGVAKRTYS